MNSRTSNAWQAYLGAKMVVEHAAAPKIWLRIHDNAVQWAIMSQNSATSKNLEALNCIDRELVAHLSEFLAANWHALCSAAGMTVYGAVALSWCKDANISQVWQSWEASGFPLKPLPEFERPAKFINPALLPKTNALSQIVAAADNSTIAICAMIAALKEPLKFDMPRDMMLKAPPQIAAFLHAQMAAQPSPDQELLTAWVATFKGTEFDTLETA